MKLSKSNQYVLGLILGTFLVIVSCFLQNNRVTTDYVISNTLNPYVYDSGKEMIVNYTTYEDGKLVHLSMDRESSLVSIRIRVGPSGLMSEDLEILKNEVVRLTSGVPVGLGESGIRFHLKNGEPYMDQYELILDGRNYGCISFAGSWAVSDNFIQAQGKSTRSSYMAVLNNIR